MQINLLDCRENGENAMRWILVSKLPVIQTELEGTFQGDLPGIEQTPSGTSVWPFVLLGLVIVILFAVVIVLLIWFLTNKKRNNQSIAQNASKSKPKVQPKSSNGSSAQISPKKEISLKKEISSSDITVPDRNGAIYPEIVLININKPDYIYRSRIVDKVIIGRREGSDIRISTDPAVSSRHCIISVKGTQFYLEDCNSSNGTRYNDQEVTSQIPIMSGGILEVGHDVYRLMIGN